ncbi:MAG: hypothetical protein NC344_04775 [Bacteroidales bacterium]|nr:hypothetical protein [Bacteroidales bacterium]MCM1147139.1 hypothetical protein [Bacteroidales bacterium]MCM1205365.1 hypothetical protein [Bacillota bacterium]MCM1509830.1 hypothetical protein [Clostridium sp.]
MDPSPAVDEAIAEASWNFQAFYYASAVSSVLVSDDISGIGAVDDVFIPLAYCTATVCFLYDNARLVAKRDREIEGIRNRKFQPNQGFTYALVATKDGYYPDVRKGRTYLHAGDVWKYGETIQGEKRYTNKFYETNSVKMVPLHYGNQMEIKVMEKMYIYGYVFKHGELPPGNKIFR